MPKVYGRLHIPHFVVNEHTGGGRQPQSPTHPLVDSRVGLAQTSKALMTTTSNRPCRLRFGSQTPG